MNVFICAFIQRLFDVRQHSSLFAVDQLFVGLFGAAAPDDQFDYSLVRRFQVSVCYPTLYWILCGSGSVVVRALHLQSTGRGFDSRPPRCRAATVGKSFTLPPSTFEVTTVWHCINWSNLIKFTFKI